MKNKKTPAPKRAGTTSRDRRWATRFLIVLDGDRAALRGLIALLEIAQRKRATRKA